VKRVLKAKVKGHRWIKLSKGFVIPIEAYILLALQSSNHPNIIRLEHYFEDEQYYYLVMEHLESPQDIARFVTSRAAERLMTPALLKRIIRELTRSVEYLHSNGIAHGDIKDENVLLHGGGPWPDLRVKLIDFGSASFYQKGVRRREYRGGSKFKVTLPTSVYIAAGIIPPNRVPRCFLDGPLTDLSRIFGPSVSLSISSYTNGIQKCI
jgi:serine/threonine protein kinase